MPGDAWDDSPRWQPSPRLTLLVPVAIALFVQVPPTIAVVAWLRPEPLVAASAIAIAAASALALLAARRWPGPTVAVVTVLVVADLFVPPDPGPPYVSLALAIVGAIVRGARLWAIIAVGSGWLAAIVTAGLQDAAWHPLRVALTTLGLAACFAIGEGIRGRRLRDAQHRAQLAARRRSAEQDQRDRIARELHDVLAHSLSQIAVQSGVGLHLFDREPEQARAALTSIRELSATGLDEVRGVLGSLRSGDRDDAPLTPVPQLGELPALVAARTGLGLTVTLDDRRRGQEPASAVQAAAYRIAQEALTNVVRHSAATQARVEVRRTGERLVVRIIDDGVGIAEGTEAGGGLRGMRERAALAGGSLEIEPAGEGGTIVTARLPWTEAS